MRRSAPYSRICLHRYGDRAAVRHSGGPPSTDRAFPQCPPFSDAGAVVPFKPRRAAACDRTAIGVEHLRLGHRRRRRHRTRGHRRGAEGPHRGRRPASRPPTYDLGAARWHRTGELLPDSVLARAARARRHPARRGRRPDGAAAASWSADCCCGCASSWTTTSTCGRRGSTRASAARWPASPEIDLVVVREGTEGPVRRHRRAAAQGHPAGDRHRGQREHRVRRGAGGPRRVRAGRAAAAQAPHPGAQDQRADPLRAAVVAHRRGGLAGAPGRHRGLPAHRRGARSTWSPTPAGST